MNLFNPLNLDLAGKSRSRTKTIGGKLASVDNPDLHVHGQAGIDSKQKRECLHVWHMTGPSKSFCKTSSWQMATIPTVGQGEITFLVVRAIREKRGNYLLFLYIEMSGICIEKCQASSLLARIGCLVSMECMHSTRTRMTCIQSETAQTLKVRGR